VGYSQGRTSSDLSLAFFKFLRDDDAADFAFVDQAIGSPGRDDGFGLSRLAPRVDQALRREIAPKVRRDLDGQVSRVRDDFFP
jgi:hypothetical protein